MRTRPKPKRLKRNKSWKRCSKWPQLVLVVDSEVESALMNIAIKVENELNEPLIARMSENACESFASPSSVKAIPEPCHDWRSHK